MGTISLFLAIALFAYALNVDFQYKKNVTSKAIFIPFIWLSFGLSRNLSRWMNIGKLQMVRSSDYVSIIEKGSPIDQIFLSSLLMLALIVLIKRRDKVVKIIKDNKIWLLLVLYCMFSIVWSESPFISLKRFIKDLNAILMVLIVLTEKYPAEAFKAVIRRNTYLLIPLSIVFCKFYPAIGRYQTSSWDFIYTGVTTHKNQLGVLCLISILVLFIDIWPSIKKGIQDYTQKKYIRICYLYVGLCIYLLTFANSMTTNICLLFGMFVFVSKRVKKHLTKIIVVISICFLTGLDEYIIWSLRDTFLSVVGRGQTISGRMDLWEAVLKTDFNRILGPGYSAFWLGERMRELIARFIFVPKQAHNGYIEVYINLGMVGLSIFIAALLSTYKKIISSFSENNYLLAFHVAYFSLYMIYNLTEATFIFNTSPLWFVFLYVSLSVNILKKQKMIDSQKI